MKLRIGPVPDSPEITIPHPWHPIKEPSPVPLQFLAIPIALAMFFVLGGLWLSITTLTVGQIASCGGRPSGWLFLLAVLIAHECLRGLAHPGNGGSPRSIMGVWPSRLLVYAHYDGEMTRNRFLVVLAAPLLVLSFVPAIACSAVNTAPPIVAWLAILNAVAACGDALMVALVLVQIPRRSLIGSKGWRTCWKRQDGEAP